MLQQSCKYSNVGKNLADFALTAEGANAVKETLKEVLKLKGQQLLSPQFRLRLPAQTAPGNSSGGAGAAVVVLRAHSFHNPYSDELEFVIGKLRVLETPLVTPASSAAAAAASSSGSTAAASSVAPIGGAGVGMQYALVQPKQDFPSLVDLSYAAGVSALEAQEEAAGAGGASGQDFYSEWPPAQTQAAARLSAEQHPHFASNLYSATAAAAASDYVHPSQALVLPTYQPPFLSSPTHLDQPTLANPYRLAPSQFLNAAGKYMYLYK